MKFAPDRLLELTTANGGTFSVDADSAAYDFCRTLTRSHYENFPVGSLLVPRRLQPHFFSVYAFARIADDIADEPGFRDASERLAGLLRMQELLAYSTSGSPLGNPIFRALHITMQRLSIPATPFLRLLTAFRQDSEFTTPNDISDLEEYCTNSANPVGELTLRIFGVFSATRAHYADQICTGLQLANFWQDISIDRLRGRCYIPKEILYKYNLTEHDLVQDNFSTNLSARLEACIQELYSITKGYFDRGSRLLRITPGFRLRGELAATIQGGYAILEKVRAFGVRLIDERPSLDKSDIALIALKAIRSLVVAKEVEHE